MKFNPHKYQQYAIDFIIKNPIAAILLDMSMGKTAICGKMIITLDEMKNYLRVDHEDDDILLESLIASSQQLCMDVARISDEESFEKEPCSKVAVMYAVAYLYEHREDANHLELTLSIRALLSGIRQEGF